MCSMSDFTDWPKTEATLEEYLIIIPPPSVQHRNTPECVFVLSSLLGVWNSSAFNHLIYKHSFKCMWFHHSTVSDTLHTDIQPVYTRQEHQSQVSQSEVDSTTSETHHEPVSPITCGGQPRVYIKEEEEEVCSDLLTSHLNTTRLH